MGSPKLVSIADLHGGAVVEKADMELAKVWENIQDINTEAKKPRKVTITITVRPNENREEAKLDIAASSTLAPYRATETRVGIDTVDGQACAVEVQDTQRDFVREAALSAAKEKADQTSNVETLRGGSNG
jgi:hypothetical protein